MKTIWNAILLYESYAFHMSHMSISHLFCFPALYPCRFSRMRCLHDLAEKHLLVQVVHSNLHHIYIVTCVCRNGALSHHVHCCSPAACWIGDGCGREDEDRLDRVAMAWFNTSSMPQDATAMQTAWKFNTRNADVSCCSHCLVRKVWCHIHLSTHHHQSLPSAFLYALGVLCLVKEALETPEWKSARGSGKALGALAHIFSVFWAWQTSNSVKKLWGIPHSESPALTIKGMDMLHVWHLSSQITHNHCLGDSPWLSCLGGDGRCVTCKPKKMTFELHGFCWETEKDRLVAGHKDLHFGVHGCAATNETVTRGCASLWGTGIDSCQGLTTNMEQNKSLKALYQEHKSSGCIQCLMLPIQIWGNFHSIPPYSYRRWDKFGETSTHMNEIRPHRYVSFGRFREALKLSAFAGGDMIPVRAAPAEVQSSIYPLLNLQQEVQRGWRER